MIDKSSLEAIASKIRSSIGIDSDKILTPVELEWVLEKFSLIEDIKIKENYFGPSKIVIDNKNSKYIYISSENSRRDKFYQLLIMIAFASITDSDSYGYSTYYIQWIFRESPEADYLALALMMPKEAFRTAVIKFSSGDGSSVKIDRMQKFYKNDFMYKRGVLMRMW